jgi:membrane protein involved in colicin uptake
LLGSTDHLASALKAGWSVIDADKAQSIRDEAAKAKAAEDAKVQEERSVQAAKQAAKQAEEIAAQNKADIELLTEAFSKTPKVLEIFTRRFGLKEQKVKESDTSKK